MNRDNLSYYYEDWLITSYSDVFDSVRQFNYDLRFNATLQEKLNKFRSWYYIPELDMFGPSKFVGYKMMTGLEYHKGYGKDGEATERALRKFFRPIQRSHPYRRALEVKLSELCSSYEKRPNRAYRINIPKKSWILI